MFSFKSLYNDTFSQTVDKKFNKSFICPWNYKLDGSE